MSAKLKIARMKREAAQNGVSLLDKVRVKMVTRDGALIQNRLGEREFYFLGGGLNTTFVEHVLKCDAREKGVSVISYSYTKDEITAIVEYL